MVSCLTSLFLRTRLPHLLEQMHLFLQPVSVHMHIQPNLDRETWSSKERRDTNTRNKVNVHYDALCFCSRIFVCMSSEVSTNNKSISETQVEMLDKHTEEHEQHDFSLRIFHAIIHSKPQKSLMDSCPYSENLMSSLLHSLKSPLTQPLRPLPHAARTGNAKPIKAIYLYKRS